MEIPNTFNYKASVPDISNVVQFNALKTASELNCMRIATVEEVHYDDLTVTVRLLNKRTLGQNPDGTPNVRDYALIRAKICYCSPFITFPISVGDDCVLLFSDREIESWFINGDAQPVNHQRMHDLTDAFAIFGIRSLPKMIELTDAEKSGVFIQNLHAKNGASGTFVSKDNKTITAVDGIVVNMTGGGGDPSITADEVIDALGYTPADTDLSNLSATGKTVIDGQWVYNKTQIANNTHLTTTAQTYDISSYLPNDNFEYEVILGGSVTSGSSSGNRGYVTLKSDISSYVELAYAHTRANATVSAYGNCIIAVGTRRTLTIAGITSPNNSTFILSIEGYRRIGTNT